MAYRECKICSASFYVKPSHLKRGWGKYCSKKCQNISQKTGTIVQCFICSKDVYRLPKELKHSKSKKYFCGKKCQTIWRNSIVYVGSEHPNWKGGKYIYRRILLGEKVTQKCVLCNFKDTRVLIVHHIDRNRNNNNVANLVWLCANCHFLVHHYEKESIELRKMLVKRPPQTLRN
jgi:hypothetical protein